MPDLPPRFAALIITFAPLFVQRSWLHARVLLVGARMAHGGEHSTDHRPRAR